MFRFDSVPKAIRQQPNEYESGTIDNLFFVLLAKEGKSPNMFLHSGILVQ